MGFARTNAIGAATARLLPLQQHSGTTKLPNAFESIYSDVRNPNIQRKCTSVAIPEAYTPKPGSPDFVIIIHIASVPEPRTQTARLPDKPEYVCSCIRHCCTGKMDRAGKGDKLGQIKVKPQFIFIFFPLKIRSGQLFPNQQ